uniref:Transmembrane protein n=1 Tax=Ascaris lumbricoides TaxID=6252 RepID=A0A0M3I3H4_ASCLU
MFALFLPKEEISFDEQKIRDKFNFIFRLLIACFLSYQILDFLFSPIWMHGYIWSLNQKLEIEMSTMTAGAIVEHHLSKCGHAERIFLSALIVFMTWAFLVVGGFRNRNRSVWYLLRLSLLIGSAVGFMRCLQMKQRLYPAIHEAFYVYLITFSTGVLLALQPEERLSEVISSSQVASSLSQQQQQQ